MGDSEIGARVHPGVTKDINNFMTKQELRVGELYLVLDEMEETWKPTKIIQA